MSGMQSPTTDDQDLQVDLNVDADLVRAELQAIGRHHFAPAPAAKPTNGHAPARANPPLPSSNPTFQDSNNRLLLNTLLSRTLGHQDDSSVAASTPVPPMRSAVSPPPTPRQPHFLEQATPAVAFVHTTHSPFTMPDGSMAPPSPSPSVTFPYPPATPFIMPTPSAPSPQPPTPAPKRKRAGAVEPVAAVANGAAKKGKAAAAPVAPPANKRAKAAPKPPAAKPAARGRGGKKAKGRGSSEDDSQDDSDSEQDDDDDEDDSEPGVGDDKSRKRKRHNQVETRRRQRMRSQIESLGRLVGSHSYKQGTVLINAIAKVKSLEDKVSALNTQLGLKQQTRELAIANQKRQSLLEAAASKRLRFAETVNRLYTGSFIFGPGSLNHGYAFMHSAVAMELVSIDGKILDCNEAYASLHERGREELIGSTIFSATHPDHLPATFQMFNRLITPAPASSVPAITAPDTPSSPNSDNTSLTIPGNDIASAMVLAVVPSSGASCLDKQIVTGSGAAVSVRVFSWSVRDNGSSSSSGAPSRPQYLRGIIVPLNSGSSSSPAPSASAPPRRASSDASAGPQPRSVITGGRSAAAVANASITIEEA